MIKDKKRKAHVFYQARLAGILEETDEEYLFVYTADYLKTGRPISLSLPLQTEAFKSAALFPFFVGMTPEGWYRDIVCATKKIDPSDDFGILLITGENTVGAVTVKKVEYRER